MPTKLMTAEEMLEKWSKKDYHGVHLLRFVNPKISILKNGNQRVRWRCLVRCSCGRQFECDFSALKRAKTPSCGCKRRPKKTVKPTERTTKELCDRKGTVSRLRLLQVWEGLPKDDCCKAWSDSPIKFVEWGLWNGFTTERRLVRRDPHKPFSPMNCRWKTLSAN